MLAGHVKPAQWWDSDTARIRAFSPLCLASFFKTIAKAGVRSLAQRQQCCPAGHTRLCTVYVYARSQSTGPERGERGPGGVINEIKNVEQSSNKSGSKLLTQRAVQMNQHRTAAGRKTWCVKSRTIILGRPFSTACSMVPVMLDWVTNCGPNGLGSPRRCLLLGTR